MSLPSGEDAPVGDPSGSMPSRRPSGTREGLPLDASAQFASPAALVDLLLFPACLLNSSGDGVYANAAWCERTGLGGPEQGQWSWLQSFAPADRPSAMAHFRVAAAGGHRVDLECRLQAPRGEARWFLLALQPLTEPEGGQRQWLCTAADIHERKSREQHLERLASIQTDMLNVSVDCIKLIALDGTLVHMNRAGCRALGVPEDSLFGMPWLPLLPSDVWPAGEEALARATNGTFARLAGRSVVPGHAAQHWDNLLTPVMGGDGRPAAVICVSREVTAEREAIVALHDSRERLAIAARVGGLGIWDYDIRRDVLHCDDGWYRIMGRDASDPIESIAAFRPFIHPDDAGRATEVEQTASELLAAGQDYAISFRIVRPNGDIRWVRSAACLVRDAGGEAARAVGFVVDITDSWRGELALRAANRALEEEKTSLARQTLEDPLTGIANRRLFDSELARICLRANETGDTVCVAMIDVDAFKAYNDRYGHPRGDVVLCRIAAALHASVRPYDVVARYGGEEFMCVLPGVDDPSPLLARLKDAVADLAIVHEDSPGGYVTISCGCVVVTSSARLSPASIVRACDLALYDAKRAGRNGCVVRPAS